VSEQIPNPFEGELEDELELEVDLEADEDESFDPDEVAARYAELPADERERLFASGLSDEQRAALAARGVLGPAALPDEAGFRSSPDFKESTWRQKLTAGLSQIHNGQIDVSSAALERLESLAALSEQLPDPREELERGVWLIDRLRLSAFESAPWQPQIVTQRIRGDGGVDLIASDDLGRERVTSFSAADVAEAVEAEAAETAEANPANVSADVFAGWSRSRQVTWGKEHPAALEELSRSVPEIWEV
jgi:hypothetical protein